MKKIYRLTYYPIFATAVAFVLCLEGVQAQGTHPDFTGIWSGNFTTKDNEFWQLEDFTLCFAGCTPTSRQHFASLIDDPANDDQSVQELLGQMDGFVRQELAEKSTPEGLALQETNTMANDPTLQCKPYGIVRAAANPLTMAIRQDGEHLIIEYEEWNQSRTIYMDGRDHPIRLTPTPLGHSVGWFDGDELIIDSAGIEADIYFSFQSGGGYSDQASVIERYTIRDNPQHLVLEMTVTDPVTLVEPHVIEKIWLSTPDVEMVEDSCGDVAGIP